MTRRRLPDPRWQTPLPDTVVGSWGPAVERAARDLFGIVLDRWQRRALNRALAYDAAGKLVHSGYLVSTARQNGKTAIVRALIAWALTAAESPMWRSIIGLAHDRAQARIPYTAVLEDLAPTSHRVGRSALTLTRYLGIRSAMYGRHRRYNTLSREARDSARGETHDLVVFDEVRTQRDYDTWSAVEPTMTASPDPLAFLISTAGDDRSVLLRSMFDRGLRIIDGAEPVGRFGMTWYAAPDELAPDDPRAILAANPSIAEGRLPIAPILESFRNTPPAQYRMERLNLWADALDEWLPAGTWALQVAPQPPGDDVRRILAVDVVPSWSRATVAVAIETDSGAWVAVAGEVVAAAVALSSVAPSDVTALLADLVPKYRPAAVAYVATAAAAPHVAAWCDAAGVATIALGAREIRSASELFRAELVGGRLTHRDDPLLATQVRAARPSAPVEGGDWYISTKLSLGNVEAVRAAAWAAWACIAPPEHEVQIFV